MEKTTSKSPLSSDVAFASASTNSSESDRPAFPATCLACSSIASAPSTPTRRGWAPLMASSRRQPVRKSTIFLFPPTPRSPQPPSSATSTMAATPPTISPSLPKWFFPENDHIPRRLGLAMTTLRRGWCRFLNRCRVARRGIRRYAPTSIHSVFPGHLAASPGRVQEPGPPVRETSGQTLIYVLGSPKRLKSG